MWNNTAEPDTSRLKAIHKICFNEYLFTDSDSALYYAKIMQDFAVKHDEKKFMSQALDVQSIANFFKGNVEEAEKMAEESFRISEGIGNKRGMASSLNILGTINKDLGNIDAAVVYFNRSLTLAKETNDHEAVAVAYHNIGLSYKVKGDLTRAIDYYSRSLKIEEEIGNQRGIADSKANMAVIYKEMQDYDKALELNLECAEIFLEIGDMHGRSGVLGNIAAIYGEQEEYEKAELYLNQQLELLEGSEFQMGLANAYSSLGVIYMVKGDSEKALEIQYKALEIRENMQDIRSVCISLSDIGIIHSETKQFNKAIEFSQRAYDLASKHGFIRQQRDAAKTLYLSLRDVGNSKEALRFYEIHISLRDSLNSEENQKEIIRQEYKYKYEKQATADSVKAAEAAKVKDAQLLAEQAQNKQHKLEANQQKQQRYFLIGGFVLAILFGGFILNRFMVTRKQKGIIEVQKQQVDKAYEELEEKNTEILDSIIYAKRIQSAILPPEKLVKEYLKSSFILYKPKDIVAGDFYWLEPFESERQNENGVLFAAADCTGHGVPGAMVSVVCNNGLNRSVREYGLTDPGQILDKTREIVIAEFEKSEGSSFDESPEDVIKDGMDIALCSLTFAQKENQKQNESGSSNSSELNAQDRSASASASAGATSDTQNASDYSALLKYAGAHNPLWIVRRTVSAETREGFALEEVKADKQPIGKFDEPKPYITHSIELNEGDSFYIFSDGYADQFGGEKGKKLKAKNFKTLLLSIQNETMERQHELIDEAFEKWKGSYEQLDDVCVIGVRI